MQPYIRNASRPCFLWYISAIQPEPRTSKSVEFSVRRETPCKHWPGHKTLRPLLASRRPAEGLLSAHVLLPFLWQPTRLNKKTCCCCQSAVVFVFARMLRGPTDRTVVRCGYSGRRVDGCLHTFDVKIRSTLSCTLRGEMSVGIFFKVVVEVIGGNKANKPEKECPYNSEIKAECRIFPTCTSLRL